MSRPVFREWSGEKLVVREPPGGAEQGGLRHGLPARETFWPPRRSCSRASRLASAAGRRAGLGTTGARHAGSRRAAVKALARELGADMVGIAPVDPKYVYDGFEGRGRVRDRVRDRDGLRGRDPRAAEAGDERRVHPRLRPAEPARGRARRWIRARGYAARAHTLRDEQLAMLPHAYAAGLGELGKHGSLINRELGCSFRIGVVTTELPLAVDSPREDGIQDSAGAAGCASPTARGCDQRRDGRRSRNRALDRRHGEVRAVLQPPLRLRRLPAGLPDQREGVRRPVQGRLREEDAGARPDPARRAALRERPPPWTEIERE